MPIGVRVIGKCKLILVLEFYEPAIAYGLEQSMRILPSWSTVINEKVGSIFVFTTVRLSLQIEAIDSQ